MLVFKQLFTFLKSAVPLEIIALHDELYVTNAIMHKTF
jgi:hypothetical protein